jgi:hypothetical protein
MNVPLTDWEADTPKDPMREAKRSRALAVMGAPQNSAAETSPTARVSVLIVPNVLANIRL